MLNQEIIFILKHMQILNRIDRENKKISSPKHNNICVLYEAPHWVGTRVPINQRTKQNFKNQVRQNSKGDFLGDVWEMRFSVSNIGKREVETRSCQNEGFRHFEAKGKILA